MVDLRNTPARALAARKQRVLGNMLAIRDAVEQASARNNDKLPSQLESLPNEIKLEVIGWISDIRSILNLARTGPQFCTLIATHEKAIAHDVVIHTIPTELMEVAAASHAASHATWNFHSRRYQGFNGDVLMSPAYRKAVNKFVDEYRQGLFSFEQQHKNGLQLYEASQYLKMHNIVRYYARTLAALAQERFPTRIENRPEITPLVLLRYEKSLYIVQLVSDLFSWKAGISHNDMHRALGVFWYSFQPWEYEQVYCAQTLLRLHIMTVIRDERNVHRDPNTSYTQLSSYDVMVIKFINWMGLKRLWSIEKEARYISMDSELFRFFYQNNMREFDGGYCMPGFGMSLQLPKLERALNEAGGDPMVAFGEFHLVPMINWYVIFNTGSLERTVGQGGSHDDFFACLACLTKAGYAFWDYPDSHKQWYLKKDGVKTLNDLAISFFQGQLSFGEGRRYGLHPAHFRDYACVCSDTPIQIGEIIPEFLMPPLAREEPYHYEVAEELAEPLELARTQA